MNKKYKYIFGIDEAGRGPLAGPIVIGAIGPLNPKSKIRNTKLLKGIKDSKKLATNQREKWYKIIKKNFECHYVSINNKIIDKIGIQKAGFMGIRKVLRKFKRKPDLVLLDGSLRAPKKYKQKTIIKGDEKIPLIAAASIIAKVARDKKMFKFHKRFPRYSFDRHKGYGTRYHYQMLKKHGPCQIHRKSFII
ncbi:MAG: ribonuclease HII [Patescibacteria group bacterium]